MLSPNFPARSCLLTSASECFLVVFAYSECRICRFAIVPCRRRHCRRRLRAVNWSRLRLLLPIRRVSAPEWKCLRPRCRRRRPCITNCRSRRRYSNRRPRARSRPCRAYPTNCQAGRPWTGAITTTRWRRNISATITILRWEEETKEKCCRRLRRR